MKKATCTFIQEKLQPYLHKQDTFMRKTISVEKWVTVALWRLAITSYYIIIQRLFRISGASASCICDEVCAVVATILLKIYVRLPAGSELYDMITDLEERWGFHNVVEQYRSHLPIKETMDYHATYCNSSRMDGTLCYCTRAC